MVLSSMEDQMDVERRQFVAMLGGAGVSLAVPRLSAASLPPSLRDPERWRRHFPAVEQRVGGHRLAYLDSAATTLRPDVVIEEIASFARTDNANPAAALHTLARRAYARYEAARAEIGRFIGAGDPEEIVFTRGTTEAINLAAASWGGAHCGRGDEILLSLAEHSSNLVPWQLLARRTGAVLRFFDPDSRGRLLPDALARRITPRTRLVAFGHVSNVLGHVNPAAELAEVAHAKGAVVLVDAAQSVPHVPVDVTQLGADFVAFSGHKMLGPMGIGVLWGRRALLDAMPPYQGGSNMAHDVAADPAELDVHLASGAHRFGAGTPNAAGAIGLAAAVRLLRQVGMGELHEHEQRLVERGLERLLAVRGLRMLGPVEPANRIAVFSFTVDGCTVPEIVRALDAEGIAVRGGDLACRPLLERFGVRAAARASAYMYTTGAEIDRLAAALHALVRRRRLLDLPR
jgi:cysteine desulfurase/selenocysteine lyase